MLTILSSRSSRAEPDSFKAPVPGPGQLLRGSAMKHANLSPGSCRQLLARKKLPFKRVGSVNGIATPLRFSGKLHGIHFQVPPTKSKFGLLDCRLALALAEVAPILTNHGVASLRIDNFYRAGARISGKRVKSQHRYGLAADVVSFTLESGEVLDVEADWAGSVGNPACGPEAVLVEPTEHSVRLRNLVCDIARRGIFHHVLTPNFNSAHRNHLHLDIKRDNKWFSVS